MNDRDDIRDDLSALIDGALDPDRQPEVEAALDTDPALRAEYDRLSGIDALYAALPREAVPEGFAQSVRDAIARRENIAAAEPTQRPVKLRMFTQATRRSVFWPVAAAATLLVGFFLWSTVNRANQANTLLTVAKSVPAKAADAVDGKEQLYKVRVMPEEKGKAEAPAAAPVAATSTHAAPSPGAPAAQEPPAPRRQHRLRPPLLLKRRPIPLIKRQRGRCSWNSSLQVPMTCLHCNRSAKRTVNARCAACWRPRRRHRLRRRGP